ncbi:WD40 repeat-like protein [Piedraia hortae CBS 480.64]|uniref:WD40 repeat-like protein n=1 Tax=Piedraia hortae CBS 480.64 TaxID=1314780 RepID=A0A6A7C854_9PEZI|nr:WD40 repeat-like protein [Piedraia hortae CBS 480.64]
MDVHRCRFVPYPEAAISALAFSRSSDSGISEPLPLLRLAVGRANGRVEMWRNSDGLCVQEMAFGGGDKGIDGLAWTRDPSFHQYRLFSIASSPEVTEWDLGTGTVRRRWMGNSSEIWCLAAQPITKDSAAAELVAGAGDGSLVLLSTAEDNLLFKRYLARFTGKNARCMCVTYQGPDVVVAGFADGVIRIYNTRTASQTRQMALGASVPGAPKSALVWQVQTFPNGDIASADSNGHVSFWDGKNYSLLRRFAGHNTDCVDLAVTSDGKILFSGDIDGRVATFKRSSVWAKTSHRRVHSGEVKAMTCYDASNAESAVITGGSEFTPSVIPLHGKHSEKPRPAAALPASAAATTAPHARLLASWWDSEIWIWHLDPGTRKLVAKLSLLVSRISSAALSPDGNILIVSTLDKIKLFRLTPRNESSISIQKSPLPEEISSLSAKFLAFSPDGAWLAILTASNEIHIARFLDGICLAETAELERAVHTYNPQSGFSRYESNIVRVAWSADSRALAVGDIAGYIDSWRLHGEYDSDADAVETRTVENPPARRSDDSDDDDYSDDEAEEVVFYGQTWRPNPPAQIPDAQVLSFPPAKGDGSLRLVVVTNANEIVDVDLLAGARVKGERKLRFRDCAAGALWDDRGRIWVYGPSWLSMVEVSAETAGKDAIAKKRKRENGTTLEVDASAKKRRKENGMKGTEGTEGTDETTLRRSRRISGKALKEFVDEEGEGDQDDEKCQENGDEDEDGDGEANDRKEKTWSSFKYRNILAVMPLGDSGREMVVVERSGPRNGIGIV